MASVQCQKTCDQKSSNQHQQKSSLGQKMTEITSWAFKKETYSSGDTKAHTQAQPQNQTIVKARRGQGHDQAQAHGMSSCLGKGNGMCGGRKKKGNNIVEKVKEKFDSDSSNSDSDDEKKKEKKNEKAKN